jgi:predicted deacylase
MIKTVTYSSRKPGKHILVLGAVHGNEQCGTTAINRVLAEFDAGEIILAAGRVTFVPICNPRAYARNVRFIERNLNRYLVPMAKPDCYEAELANILCPLLEQCDVLLDIHSYTVGGAPFTLVSQPNEATMAFAASLGDYTIITGWADAYATTGRKENEADKHEGTGTVEYAHQHSALGLTIECGQHNDPHVAAVAYRAIHNALKHFDVVDNTAPPAVKKPRIIAMQRVYYRGNAGQFTKTWKNLHPVNAGELIAINGTGGDVAAPSNGVIIMPKENAKPGEEWFYFGVPAV